MDDGESSDNIGVAHGVISHPTHLNAVWKLIMVPSDLVDADDSTGKAADRAANIPGTTELRWRDIVEEV